MNSDTTKFIWFNGKMVPWADAKVHVTAHALHYGSAVFEGIRAYATKNGPQIFRLKDHIDRLFNSAKIYRFPVAQTKEEVMDACKKVISENGLEYGYIRPLIFMGEVGLGVKFKKGVNAEIMEKTPELEGNYLEDKQYKHEFTMYVRDLWDKKDKLLDKMHADYEESLRK